MSLFEPAPQPWPDRMLAIFRIVAGLIFITAGTTKLFGFPPIPVPTPPLVLMSQIGIGAIMELVGGVLIVLGLFTRPTSFLLAGEMAVAYWQFHAPGSIWPTVNQGIAAIMYCFLFLYLMVAGAGAWSIDAAIARSRRHRVAANGFTLIELMIPIVIIAIIAAIIIPNAESARMGGNESSAIGNMHSIFAGQIIFQARHERFAASLPELAEGDSPLISANLADGENSGYHFETELTTTGFPRPRASGHALHDRSKLLLHRRNGRAVDAGVRSRRPAR